MNVHVFEEVKKLIQKYKPKSFCEIGCHNGLTAKAVCREIASYYPRLKYYRTQRKITSKSSSQETFRI